jgi:hypothetical protein
MRVSKSLCLFIVLGMLLSSFISSENANAQTSAPATLWQQNYRDYYVLDGANTLSNLIQTSDGGFAFLSLGYPRQGFLHPATLFKVNSTGNIVWVKTLDSFTASNISQTSDEGYEIWGNWRPAEDVYLIIPALIKTDSNGNIEWSKNYSSTPINEEYSNKSLVSTMIQTSDGGFAYIKLTRIVKTDSNNQTQWEKPVAYTQPQSLFEIENHYPVRFEPVELCSLIETSDGSLAAIGTVLYEYDMPYNAMASLIKTETFLPLPTASPTPYLPSDRNAPHLDPIFYLIPIAVIFVAIVVSVLIYRRHRKTVNSVKKL